MENTFGSFLKQKRQEKNLTQKDLAKELFVSESAVSKWEKDVAHPDITLLPKLSKILEVSEHELITASVDKERQNEKKQAKKWRTLSFTWSLFFYISYAIALIPCFICDLAINKSLTWFWIVASALLLAFTFTNLPKLIKKHKLLLLPLSVYLALCLLLGVCAIYTNGNWFWVVSISVLFAMIIVFTPIYISKYKAFEKVRKFNDSISIFIDFIVLNILLIIIEACSQNVWYLKIALPISTAIYLVLNIFLSIKFLKLNKLLKTSIILYLVDVFLYGIPPFIKVNNTALQREIDDINITKANFSKWIPEITLEQNVHFIIFLSITFIATAFLMFGLIKCFKNNKNAK